MRSTARSTLTFVGKAVKVEGAQLCGIGRRLFESIQTQRNASVLDTLRRITQELNRTTSLDGALDIVVRQVKECLAVDVCSVYLVDASRASCILMATDGLDPKVIDRIQFEQREGLVGVVLGSGQPLSTTNA